MLVMFRVDSSVTIGSGHLMRCLALAAYLRNFDIKIEFICKNHIGNLSQKIINAGFVLHNLPIENIVSDDMEGEEHASWLGGSIKTDIALTLKAINSRKVDWLVIDHYAIDNRWQKAIKSNVNKIIVIDDLGNRSHDCEILLDQNLGSCTNKYVNLVPSYCKLLLGSQYALLREEFRANRFRSLAKRSNSKNIEEILITLGGTDPLNYTERIIRKIDKINSLTKPRITVLLGGTNEHIQKVQAISSRVSFPIEVVVDTNCVSEHMCRADLIIGSSGTSCWERCCLGIPAIQFVVAPNQFQIANALHRAGAIILVQTVEELPSALSKVETKLAEMSLNARRICDGSGIKSLVDEMGIKH